MIADLKLYAEYKVSGLPWLASCRGSKKEASRHE
jgi:hypothetical protein